MRARRIAKAGLVELVLWDVILVVLVGGLVFVDGQLEARAAAAKEKQRPASTDGGPLERPGGKPSDGTRPAGGTKPDRGPGLDREAKIEEKARAELKKLRAAADGKVKAGNVLAALAVYEGAPAWLKTSQSWQGTWPKERKRLGSLQQDADLYVCMATEVQLAADRGRPKSVEKLLARVPASYRARLDGELSWARSHVPPKGEGGLAIRGFSPDQVKLDGQRCVIDCTLGRQKASALLNELDDMAGVAKSFFGDPGARVTLKVLGPAEPAVKAGADEVVIYQRQEESAEQLGPRARLAVARWLMNKARGKGRASSLHYAVCDVLAGAVGLGGVRPKLTTLGKARRRLFLLDAPDGSGSALQELGSGKFKQADPGRVGPWALLHYAAFASDPAAVDLKIQIKKALRGGGSLSAYLTPIKSAGLESAWVAWLERA